RDLLVQLVFVMGNAQTPPHLRRFGIELENAFAIVIEDRLQPAFEQRGLRLIAAIADHSTPRRNSFSALTKASSRPRTSRSATMVLLLIGAINDIDGARQFGQFHID